MNDTTLVALGTRPGSQATLYNVRQCFGFTVTSAVLAEGLAR